jgi:hypothetical protein
MMDNANCKRDVKSRRYDEVDHGDLWSRGAHKDDNATKYKPYSDAYLKHKHELAEAHHRADSVYAAFNDFAPRPYGDGESVVSYRKRLLNPYKKHSPAYKDSNLENIMDSAAFDQAEQTIWADAKDFAGNPANFVMNGDIKYVSYMDDQGRRITDGHMNQNSPIGVPKTFFGLMKVQPRGRVVRFNTPTAGAGI